MRNLMLHHSADSSEEPQLERVRAYHDSGAGGKWPPGLGIQYTFFIEREGPYVQNWPVDKITYHAGSEGWNRAAMAVCLAGDFTKGNPTESQLEQLYALWKSLEYPTLMKHKDVRQTACPGSYDFIKELTRRRNVTLEQRLMAAMKALPRFIGTSRGGVLERLIVRLKRLLTNP